jgi:Phosphopantetheine attachment site.
MQKELYPLTEIEKIIKKVLKKNKINFKKLNILDSLDSLQMLTLITMLEKKFKLKLKNTDFESENFKDIYRIKSFLEKYEKIKKKK